MNRAYFVVFTTLGIIVLGLAGVLYYRPTVFTIPVLGLLVILWLAAVLTRPVGTAMPSTQVSSSKWMRGWVLVNGLAWLTAAGVLLIPLYWLGSLPAFHLAKPFMLWMPVAGVAMSAIWAAGQWIGLATIYPEAGRWSAKAFIGAFVGYACFYVGGAILLTLFPIASESVGNNIILVATMAQLCLLPIAGWLYVVPLLLSGYITGRLQTQLPNPVAPSYEKRARDNALNMAMGGILGPLGGIVYALLSGRILRLKLFGEEESK